LATAGDDTSIGTLVSRLVQQMRTLAGAEVALFKARAGERFVAYKGAAIMFAVAGLLALLAAIGLTVGAILSLATVIGPGWATLAVVAVLLAVALVIALVGKSRLSPADRSARP
jgi:uncharacterized membrane protein YqjE